MGSVRRTDVLVTAVVAFPTLMDAGWNQAGTRQADWITFALAAVAVGSLLWRRRWPLPVTVLCGGILTALYLMDHEGELLNLPTMVGLYTVAVQGERRRSIVVGAVAAAWSGGLAEVVDSSVGSPMLEMLWPLVPLALGEAVRARHELQAEHEAQARLRVAAERVGIAREFHDVVAHTMAAVNVQMGVAVAAFDARPERAREALVQAHASSKDALHELRATVSLLRDGPPGTAPDPRPAPRIAQIADLAGTARASGVAVTVRDERVAHDELPAAVELAAYRIVQEALTNVVRHARAATATVALALDGADLVVEVCDDGVGPSARNGTGTGSGSAGGHGLLGMTERAAALGGSLAHGAGPDGRGYRVRAILPTRVGAP